MDPDPVYGSEEHYRACARRARAVRRRLGRQWQVIANNATPTLTKAKIQQDLKRRPGDWSFFLDRLAGGFAKADLGPASYNEKRAAYLSEIIGETRYTISNPISGPADMEIRASRSKELADFPWHVNDIVDIVRNAKENIIIHADAVDYGSFRHFRFHEELIKTIVEKAEIPEKISFMLSTDHEPMSRANKYKMPANRESNDFEICVDQFLKSLRDNAEYDELVNVEEYKRVQESLGRANWVNGPEMITLAELQMKLHRIQLAKLLTAGVKLRGSNTDSG